MAKMKKKAKPAPKAKKATARPGAAQKAAKKLVKKISAVFAKPKAGPAKKAAGKKAPPPPVKVAKKVAPLPVKAGRAAAAKVVPPVLKGKGKAAPAPVAPVGKGKKAVMVEVLAPPPAAKGKGKRGAEAGSASGKKRCREPGCDHEGNLGGYCRLHYIKNWRKIKRKEAILGAGQLNNYVEELVSKYPDKYLDVIRQDLASEKDWSKVVTDLELESVDEEFAAEEEAETAAEPRRPNPEFDDEGDSF